MMSNCIFYKTNELDINSGIMGTVPLITKLYQFLNICIYYVHIAIGI